MIPETFSVNIIKSFCRGVQMLHGGSFYKKGLPWPPEAKKKGAGRTRPPAIGG